MTGRHGAITPVAPAVDRSDHVLTVEDLTIAFSGRGGEATVVEEVSFALQRGRTLGLVGESGSGKSVTALGIIGLLPRAARVVSGRVRYGQTDLLTLSEREMADHRGRHVAMVFQEPMSSLNPAFTIGAQIAEGVRRHLHVGRRAAWQRAIELLDRVGIANARLRARAYPHQFSGGMRQRAMIAIALACEPRILIADEPTTALDVTVQAQVLDLLRDLQDERGLAILFVTHDLSVVADLCHDVAVLYAGQVVETGPRHEIYTRPQHPYTEGLLASIPTGGRRERMVSIPGAVPRAGDVPDGCRFHPRCPYRRDGRCTTDPIAVYRDDSGRGTRCVRSDELTLGGVR